MRQSQYVPWLCTAEGSTYEMVISPTHLHLHPIFFSS